MRVRWRGDPGRMRTSFSFSASGTVHAVLLGLVAFGNSSPVVEKPRSLYDEMIRPEERRVVWYHLQDRLPDVHPSSASRATNRPLRATRKFEQRIVAGPKDDSRPPQLVWSPAPEVSTPKPQRLPNVLAVEMKRPSRPFTPPVPAATAAAKLLDAAPAAGALGAAPAGPNLSALTKRFSAPAVKVDATAKLPDAAPATGALGAAPAGPNLSALTKKFSAPVVKVDATAKLPDAAPAVSALGAAPAGPNLSALTKKFSAPAVKVDATAKLPDAAPSAGALGAAPAGPNLRAPTKVFTPPPSRAAAPGASGVESAPPALDSVPAPDAPQLAIIGLHPAPAPDLPAAPESRSAGFSAGPKPHPKGAETDGAAAGVAVPGVTVREGISRQALLAEIRPMAHVIPTAPPPGSAMPTRVSSAPDPTLQGRVVYTMAIQMPNVTSWSGSWLVWYAARENAGGSMRAPSPVRKVDPKYIASAMAEGVQGVVRLAATIHRDGHVDTVKLLRHLDDRLDRSAMEALGKWEFEPARRDGAPVDVDAVFEIPFRLAPKSPK